MNKNKRIHHKHIHALRDLSRCVNFSGVKIKKELLFRSSYLGRLSSLEAKKFIDEFNIGTVIDFRTYDEVNSAPDVHPDLVDYYHLPVLSSFDNPLVTKENRNQILLDITKKKGGTVKYLSAIYRKLVSDEESLEYYRKAFDILLNKKDDKSIIFHCTQGKDRTGIFAALILLVLGVEKTAIVNDYLRFNNAYRIKNFMISFIVAFRFLSIKVSRDLYYLQMAHYKLINASLNEILKNYGSYEKFIKDGLKLDENKVQKLKEMYLVKA